MEVAHRNMISSPLSPDLRIADIFLFFVRLSINIDPPTEFGAKDFDLPFQSAEAWLRIRRTELPYHPTGNPPAMRDHTFRRSVLFHCELLDRIFR
jgi:hypothetical protein